MENALALLALRPHAPSRIDLVVSQQMQTGPSSPLAE